MIEPVLRVLLRVAARDLAQVGSLKRKAVGAARLHLHLVKAITVGSKRIANRLYVDAGRCSVQYRQVRDVVEDALNQLNARPRCSRSGVDNSALPPRPLQSDVVYIEGLTAVVDLYRGTSLKHTAREVQGITSAYLVAVGRRDRCLYSSGVIRTAVTSCTVVNDVLR